MQKSITITGSLGSGKSTVAKRLSSKLGLTYYSTGLAQRQIAAQMGITTLELNHLADKDGSIDEKIDGVIRSMNNDEKAYIVDSRLAWHFMPASFKVKLTVQKQEAANRIFNDKVRSGESKYNNPQDVLKAIEERRASERERFLRVYGVDIENDSAFDLVLDTTNLSIDEACDAIEKAYKKS